MYERNFAYLAPILVKGSGPFSRAVAPVSVFDSLINAQNVLLEMSEAISRFHDLRMFEDELLTEIEKNQGFISAAKALFSYLTSGKVEILLPEAVVVPLEASRGKFGLETSFPFLKGSLGSAETFMTSAKSMVAVPKAKNMYGPTTLKIMETLGYETESNPCTIELQKLSTY